MGKILAICISEKKGTQKKPIESARLVEEWGIEGDAHVGKWHRQVSMLSFEKIEAFREKGADVDFGAFGENLVVEGFDLSKVPVGTKFQIGEAILELTQIGKECHSHCAIYKVMGDCIMPREGVFTRVLKGGEIKAGDKVNFTVPTGNFGNILAAYFAKQMGVPFGKLICASNDNKVLYDFFRTGTYDKNREFILTTSPSMDILVSSNLERLLYLSCGRDAAKTKAMMEQLSTNGKYEITADMKEFMKDFCAGYADMEENAKEIRKVFDDTGYLIDTHTGVAAAVYEQYKTKTGDTTKTIIASTASPYKFSPSVLEAIAKEPVSGDEYAMVDQLHELSNLPIPAALADLKNKERRFTSCIDKNDLQSFVLQQLHLG